MTATPIQKTRSKETLRKAGTLFGLDLSGLFDDVDGEDLGGFEGFQPGFKVSANIKGRSPSTMTYKAPTMPSRTAEFTLTPRTESAFEAPALPDPIKVQEPAATPSAPAQTQAPAAAPAQAAPQQPAEKIYQGYAGGISALRDQPEYGGIGFGKGDLDRALSEGYSESSIKTYLENFPGMIGPDAASRLGITPKATSSIASSAPSTQPAAQPAPEQRYTPTSAPVSQYQAPTAQNWQQKALSEGGFGMGSFGAAKAAGVGDNEIRQFLSQNRGVTVGPSAADVLGWGGGNMYGFIYG